MLVVALAVADGPLNGFIEARKVVTQDTGREVYLSADKATPRDVIEYRITYANNGESALRNIAITDPIPLGTNYISSSATRPESGEVQFSIDGGNSYHEWPIRIKKVIGGKEKWIEATPDMVTHIRWVIDGSFEPDTEVTFTYRATVK